MNGSLLYMNPNVAQIKTYESMDVSMAVNTRRKLSNHAVQRFKRDGDRDRKIGSGKFQRGKFCSGKFWHGKLRRSIFRREEISP